MTASVPRGLAPTCTLGEFCKLQQPSVVDVRESLATFEHKPLRILGPIRLEQEDRCGACVLEFKRGLARGLPDRFSLIGSLQGEDFLEDSDR